MGEQVEVEQLFHKSWFRPLGLSTLGFILYLPIGLCVFIIRAFILLQFILLGYLLPPSKFRQKCLKVMSTVLGVSCTAEGELNQGGSTKIYVANHITSIDHYPIHLATNATFPIKQKLSSLICKPFGMVEASSEPLTKEQIDSGDPLILFPEETTTNGECGLLAFTSEIPSGVVIQPVAVKVSRMFLNTSYVGSSFWQEALIILLLPNTHFTLRFLPQETVDSEGSWKRRAQTAISSSLSLTATKLNMSDKLEFVKRLYFKPPSIATMTREVQRQLAPHSVPPELIIDTLQRTGSIEAALESLRNISLSGGTLPSTFSKSATQRMMTFQERKRLMINTARQKYIEKHELNVPL